MKPKTTWVLVANARLARVLVHKGAGHGLHSENTMTLHAEEVAAPKDRAGVGHSIAGPGRNAVEQKDGQEQAEKAFAQRISDELMGAHKKAKFDRLIIVAGPHMLGVIRKSLSPDVTKCVLSEVDKDLTHLSPNDIGAHLGDVIYV